MKRKVLSLLLVVCCLVGASACQLPFFGEDTVSVSYEVEEIPACIEQTTENMVAIRILKTHGKETLSDMMEYLRAEGAFTYTESGGMITAINGKENAADWSYCWMLYTSDAEFANTEWGTVEYVGETLGSAVVGAETLPVTEGAVYVWNYTGF